VLVIGLDDVNNKLKTFNDLKFSLHPMMHVQNSDPIFGMFEAFAKNDTVSTHSKMFFDNGYGVSVVTGDRFYSNFEIAILKGNEANSDLCYTTPITNDVIGCVTKDEITEIMKRVQEL
jgi:hypothetical protein